MASDAPPTPAPAATAADAPALAVIVVCVGEADFLRQTLPRSRRALPDAKFVVVTLTTDTETLTIANAMKVWATVSLPPEVLTKNGAKNNVAALVRAGQLRVAEGFGNKVWTILTRPQVVLDPNIGGIDFASLDTNGVYGSFFHEIHTQTELLRFQLPDVTSAEVREHTPTREFLMYYGSDAKYPRWADTAAEATDEFVGEFVFQYMLQIKLGHLGGVGDDAEERVTRRWEERARTTAAPVRIAPVHPGASQKKDEERKAEEEKRVEAAVAEAEKSSAVSNETRKPEAEKAPATEAPKPEAEKAPATEAPKPEAEKAPATEAPKPETEKPSDAPAPKPDEPVPVAPTASARREVEGQNILLRGPAVQGAAPRAEPSFFGRTVRASNPFAVKVEPL